MTLRVGALGCVEAPNAEGTNAVRDALATHGIEVARLGNIPGYPFVMTDFETVVVKLRSRHDDASGEAYWTRILADEGVPVAPLLLTEVVPIQDRFAVVTRYLAPDREPDERDASAAGRIMRHVHDIAFEYREPDGTFGTPHDSQPRNFVVHRGALHLVDLNNVEWHDRAHARDGAVGDFVSAVRATAQSDARAQFLAAYDA